MEIFNETYYTRKWQKKNGKEYASSKEDSSLEVRKLLKC